MSLNATNLFEDTETTLLPCSESFWRSLFALFVLQGAPEAPEDFAVPIHVKKPGGGPAPWYKKRFTASEFAPGRISLADVAVEPTAPQTQKFLTKMCGGSSHPSFGIRPDILIRGRGAGPAFTFIESKTSTGLQANQIENYCAILAELDRKGHPAELLLLASIGMSNALDGQVVYLQGRLGTSFGLILWETVLSLMVERGFRIPGVDVQTWTKYVGILTEAVEPS